MYSLCFSPELRFLKLQAKKIGKGGEREHSNVGSLLTSGSPAPCPSTASLLRRPVPGAKGSGA